MEAPFAILIVSFVIMVVINVPVAFALGVSAFLATASLKGQPPAYDIAQHMTARLQNFSLLAIPFFILAGNLMGRGGIARRLINFASSLVGGLPGGLAYVNTLTCMLFGALSGSATAAVSSIGGFMIPEMNKKGYGREFNTALTTAAATTGLMIPPSNIMIVYAVVAQNVSIGALFIAGIVPGIVVGICIAVAAGIICVATGMGQTAEKRGEVLRHGLAAIPALLLIIIVLGGILGGVFSATEAAAVAVAYAFLLSCVAYPEFDVRFNSEAGALFSLGMQYNIQGISPRGTSLTLGRRPQARGIEFNFRFTNEIPYSKLPEILLESGKTTAIVMLLIGASMAMSWLLSYREIPQQISAALIGLTTNKFALLLLINGILLAVGTVMDMTPAVLIFTPIFLPIALTLGLSPVHFGIILIANLCIGLCTPPVGTCLFVGCSVGKTTIARTSRSMLPFYVAMVTALLLITFIPPITMALPHLLGYK